LNELDLNWFPFTGILRTLLINNKYKIYSCMCHTILNLEQNNNSGAMLLIATGPRSAV
jgi:hypothetical protein